VRVGVCIPWRPAPSRVPLLAPTQANIVSLLPEAEFFLHDSGHETFNRSASINGAVRDAENAGCDVVVICGADTLLIGDLRAAVNAAFSDGRAHIAYTQYVGLNATGTARFFAQGQLTDDWPPHEIEYATTDARAGFVAVTPAAYWDTGGHNEDFIGWGYEDTDFAIRANLVRHDGLVVALYHEPDANRPECSEANKALFKSIHGDNA
jgi:hypothetical protein